VAGGSPGVVIGIWASAHMSDQPDNLVLIPLRHMDENVDRLRDDMRDVKERLRLLEGIERRFDLTDASS